MLSIINRALSWAITSLGNKFNLKKRSRLIKALDNGFYVKFMQFEIGLLKTGTRRSKGLKSLGQQFLHIYFVYRRLLLTGLFTLSILFTLPINFSEVPAVRPKERFI